MKPTIFISYSWANTDIADYLDKTFEPTGIIIKRDRREIGYKDSIKDYMKQVRSTDYVLLIISDDFLKSESAMFEVLELLKDEKFRDKILPVVVDNTKIYKSEEQLGYIEYWTIIHRSLEENLKSVNPTDSINLLINLKHYESIKRSIGEFLSHIIDMQSPSFSILKEENFKRIFRYIGVSDQNLINAILAVNKIKNDEEKEIELDRLEAEYPNNSKIYFLKAHYAYDKGQITKSTHFYRKSISLDSTFGFSYYNLAFNVQKYEKDFNEAINFYEKSIEYSPNNINAHLNLSTIYILELGNAGKALELLNLALQVEPNNPEIYYRLGLLYDKDFKDYLLAKKNYLIAIRLKKDFVKARYHYGFLLRRAFRKFADAKQEFDECLEFEPENKNVLKELAQLLEEDYRQYDTAKIYYNRFIKIEPNEIFDHYLYSTFLILHFSKTDKDLARYHYEIACSIDPLIRSPEVDILFE